MNWAYALLLCAIGLYTRNRNLLQYGTLYKYPKDNIFVTKMQ